MTQMQIGDSGKNGSILVLCDKSAGGTYGNGDFIIDKDESRVYAS